MSSRKLVTDTIFYAALQLSNFIVPLVTLPYVTRIVGVERYGVLELSFVFVSLFSILTKFGFEYTATRDIARCSKDATALLDTFNLYFNAKIIVFAAATILFGIAIIAYAAAHQYLWVFILTYLSVVADCLMPTWFLRGVGKVRKVALFNLFAKFATLPLIFCLIRTPEDYIFRPAIMSATSIIISIICVAYVVRQHGLKIELSFKKKHLGAIYSGAPLFVSSVSVLMLGAYNMVFMSMLTPVTEPELGVYAAPSKIIQIIQNVVALSITQVFFSHFSVLAKNDISAFYGAVRKNFIATGALGLALAAVLVCSSGLIVQLVFGSEFSGSSEILKAMSVLPAFMMLNNLIYFQCLSNVGEDKKVMLALFLIVGINIASIQPAYELYGILGVAYQRTLIQVIAIAVGLAIIAWKRRMAT